MINNYIPLKIITVILLLCSFFSSSNITAQSVWYGREKANSNSLEINKPFTPSIRAGSHVIPGLDFGSGSIFLSGRYSLKKK